MQKKNVLIFAITFNVLDFSYYLCICTWFSQQRFVTVIAATSVISLMSTGLSPPLARMYQLLRNYPWSLNSVKKESTLHGCQENVNRSTSRRKFCPSWKGKRLVYKSIFEDLFYKWKEFSLLIWRRIVICTHNAHNKFNELF